MVFLLFIAVLQIFLSNCEEEPGDYWQNYRCQKAYTIENCDFSRITRLTVEDFERCAPAKLPIHVRNYYLGRAGRGVTYIENRRAFERIKIIPKMLHDVSYSELGITVLGQKVAFPIGVAPSAQQVHAHPDGELATAKAAANMNTVMILSSYSANRIEDVAAAVHGRNVHLWMQLYVFPNRSITVHMIRRAERSGYKAFVLTVDSNIEPSVKCDAKEHPAILNRRPVNVDGATTIRNRFAVITPKDIMWLKSVTPLPIVAKGVLTGEDATRVILAGASAIVVSNHGGRQLDSVPATIDALSDVVNAVNMMHPIREVYVDGGFRNGFDVYKALARGAKMVFVGRPALWGLTMGGAEGVIRVLSILKDEFNSTMLLAGSAHPSQITSDTIYPAIPNLAA